MKQQNMTTVHPCYCCCFTGPRSAPKSYETSSSNAGGMNTSPPGHYVYTPLLRDDGTTVIVNRGWVPQTAPTWPRPSGTVELAGILRQGEKVSSSFVLHETAAALTSMSVSYRFDQRRAQCCSRSKIALCCVVLACTGQHLLSSA